jgi:eukaryotic-like serine/threonine-protein kinase
MQAGSVIGTVLSGRYRLESKLGSGGMSTVYLATDETLERRVAVKVLHAEISDDPDQLERFRREARAVAKLSHPNVVSVIDAGQDAGHPYIVFEYIEGETLKQRIERLGHLALDESAAYAIEVGRGLAAAHGRRLVHRDVKPQNVLIDPEGRAKVTDFGIARSLESKGLTATGRVLGTTDYVAPEQAMGRSTDARSDIYSLGVLLYEMLTGEVPFRAETQVGVAMKHVNEPLPAVETRRPEVSAALAAVVETATAKIPEQRYETIAAMLRDLEAALEVEVSRAGRSTGEVTTVLDSVPAPRRRLLTRRRMSWAGIVLVLAAAAAAVAIVVATTLGGPEDKQEAEGGPAVTELQGANDFDPLSIDGVNEEHPDEVQLAVDGNPGTAWSTETYETDNLGKDGVGLYVDAGKPVAAQRLEVRTDTPDWEMEVYGTAEDPPPDSIEEWGRPIGSASSVEERVEIPLDTTGKLRYYLIWITSPAPNPDEEDGGFLVHINEVRLLS